MNRQRPAGLWTSLVALLAVPATCVSFAALLAVAPPSAAASPPAIGVVTGWGANYDGQAAVPAALGAVRSIAAGSRHSLAARADGTVVAWGLNTSGQASPPAGLTDVVAVAAGAAHSLALMGDGTVVAWGRDVDGEADVPAGLDHVIAVAAGGHHSLALRDDHTVVGWGDAAWAGAPPAGLGHVVAISAGWRHSLALRDDGTVVGWGYDDSGETHPPAGLAGVRAIAAGQFYSVAARSDGSVVVWGNDVYGHTPPVGLGQVTAVSAGDEFCLALRSDDTVAAWGYGPHGELAQPVGLRGVSRVAAGGIHALVASSSAITFGAAGASVAENAGATTLVVTRNDIAIPAAVTLSRISGTATAGSDYRLISGRLYFDIGEATKRIPVTIVNDTAREGPETIVFALSAPGVGTTLGSRTSVTVTIRASDQRPDALVSTSASSGYVGNDVYNTTGYRQTRVVSLGRGHARDFYVRIYDDGNVTNTFAVKGSAAPSRCSVRYYVGSVQVTTALRSAAGYRVTLARGAYRLIRVHVTLAATATIGSTKTVTVSATWTGDGVRTDVVKATVRVVR